MNKLKTAVKALQDYLGTDRRGLALLEAVTEIANSQRKENAALREFAAGTDTTIEQLRKERDAARSEIVSLKVEIEVESAKRHAAENRYKIAVRPIEEQEQPSREAPEKKIRWLLKQVRKRFAKFPATPSGLYVEEFVKTFSHDEFAGLGMCVAAVAFVMNIPVVIRSECPLGVRKTKDVLPEIELAKFVHWFRDAVAVTNLENEIYTRSGHLGPESNLGYPVR